MITIRPTDPWRRKLLAATWVLVGGLVANQVYWTAQAHPFASVAYAIRSEDGLAQLATGSRHLHYARLRARGLSPADLESVPMLELAYPWERAIVRAMMDEEGLGELLQMRVDLAHVALACDGVCDVGRQVRLLQMGFDAGLDVDAHAHGFAATMVLFDADAVLLDLLLANGADIVAWRLPRRRPGAAERARVVDRMQRSRRVNASVMLELRSVLEAHGHAYGDDPLPYGTLIERAPPPPGSGLGPSS